MISILLLVYCSEPMPLMDPLQVSSHIYQDARFVAEDIMSKPLQDINVFLMTEQEGFYDFCGKKWIEGEDIGDGTISDCTCPALDGCFKYQDVIFVLNYKTPTYHCRVIAHEMMHAIGQQVYGNPDSFHTIYDFNQVYTHEGCL